MNKKTTWVKYLLSFGIDETLLGKVNPAINNINHRTLGVALAVCILLFGGLLVSALLGSTSGLSAWAYGGLGSVCIILYAAERMEYKRTPGISKVVFYIVVIMLMVYCFRVGIFMNPNELAVTACIMLCIAPSILLDRPWRISVVMLAIAIAFCICAFAVKPFDVALTDLIDVTAATVFGLTIGIQTGVVRVRGFVEDYAKSRVAKLDGLTGILNKSAFIEEASCLMEAGVSGALMIIDADKFKHVNDTYGHATGDEVIKAISDAVAKSMRGNDVAGRFGGDEFCVLLTGEMPPDTPENYFGRVMKAFQQLTRDVRSASGDPLTLSAGAALVSKGASYEEAFAKADEAMYEAKQTGGAHVVTR